VAIATHDSMRWIDGCLASVAGQDYAGAVVQVVDNGSTDGTAEHVEARWPGVHVLRLPENVGYGAALNAGARLWPGHHVFALNADTVVQEQALRRLAETLSADGELAVVAPWLENADGSLQHSAHEFPSLAAFAREVVGLKVAARLGGAEVLDEIRSAPVYADWATGAALLIRREAWDAVGGFDPRYHFFVEEVDLQRRLRDVGYRVALDPRARVTHFGGRKPIPPSRFARAHDGWERYFGTRHGRRAQLLARTLLCGIAATRCAFWLAIAVARPRRRLEAARWAWMFARVVALSAPKLPGAAVRRHSPYRPSDRA
jgi:GT2 family glycosyltransferase